MDDRVLHPSLARLKRIAIALGDLSGDVVFIGGEAIVTSVLPPPVR